MNSLELLARLLMPGLAAALTGWLSGPVLRALPEPSVGLAGVSATDVAAKPAYASLAKPAFRIGVATLAAAATAVVAVTLPLLAWPVWLVVSTVGVLLAAIDGATTWLPARLTHAGWLLVALLAPLGLLAGGRPADLLRVGAGAAVAGLLFWTVWFVSRGGLAYGDVRLAPLLGAAGASVSWSMLVLVLMLGTVAGAAHGLARRARGRSDAFPYAPGLVMGTFFAPLLAALAAP